MEECYFMERILRINTLKRGLKKHNEKVIKKIFTRDMKSECADEKRTRME